MLSDYLERLGPIAQLLPNDLQTQYQRIHIEYLLMTELETNPEHIKSVLRKGLELSFSQANIKDVTEPRLQKFVDQQFVEIEESYTALQEGLDAIKDHLAELHNNQSTSAFLHSMQVMAFLREIVRKSSSSENLDIQKLEKELLDILETNNFDFFTHFQLAWVYCRLLDKPKKAESHFSIAVSQSRKAAPAFYTFIQRHFAFFYFQQKEYTTALKLINECLETYAGEGREIYYEQIRYQLYVESELSDNLPSDLKKLSLQSPLYFLLIQREIQFTQHPYSQNLLSEIHENRVSEILKKIEQHWGESSMRRISMAEGCNVNRVFHRSLNKHRNDLDDIPFQELNPKGCDLLKDVIQLTRANIAQEIDKRHRMYTTAVNEKRSKYAFLNTIGRYITGAMFYVFMALLFLGFYLLLDRYLIPGDSGITLNNWMMLFGGSLLTLAIGFGMTVFETNQVQKIYAKQKQVDDALEKLHKDEQNSLMRSRVIIE